jgi:hypothetical protein
MNNIFFKFNFFIFQHFYADIAMSEKYNNKHEKMYCIYNAEKKINILVKL